MSVFISVWVGFLHSASRVLLLLLLRLLSLARRFFSLLPRKLFSLEKALLFLRLLELNFPFGVQFLLFELLLGGCGSFCAEVLNFLFFFGHFNLSFFLFNHCLHLRLLHEAGLGHQGPVAYGSRHDDALRDRGPCHG